MKKKEKKSYQIKLLDNDQNKSLREIVFESIRNAIVEGQLLPGERLMEVQLARELGVSRTPVREAIRKLELEGWVKMETRKGAYVTPLSIRDFVEMMQIRGALEALVAKLSAENATQADIDLMHESNNKFKEAAKNNDIAGIVEHDIEFHEALYQSSGTAHLIKMLHSIREQLKRIRVEYVQTIDDKVPLIGQHESIIEYIEKHMPLEAQQVAEKHISITEKEMLDIMIQDENY